MEQFSPYVFYPKYSQPNHRIPSFVWHPAVHEYQPPELNRGVRHFHDCHDTWMRISKWKNHNADGMTECPLQYLQTVQTVNQSQISHYLLIIPHATYVISVPHQLTEFVAKICKFGLASSISFWIIRKNDSTNKFSVCAWQAISNRSIASMAISTNLQANTFYSF